jgi:hypothetical protein
MFKSLQNGAGVAMILSGFALTSLMKKENAVTSSQNTWLSMMSTKFVLSMLLTPFCDKFIKILSGNLMEESKSWKQVILMLKFAIVIGVYAYSAVIRNFREAEGNFEDSKGFARVLDGMIKNLR